MKANKKAVDVPIDILIHGAGLMGTFLAHDLSNLGYSVAVSGTNRISNSETVHAQGIIHSGYIYSPRPSFAELLFEANRLWSEKPYLLKLLEDSEPFAHRFFNPVVQSKFEFSWKTWAKTSNLPPLDSLRMQHEQNVYVTLERLANPLQIRQALIERSNQVLSCEQFEGNVCCQLLNGDVAKLLPRLEISATGRDCTDIEPYGIFTLIGFDSDCVLNPIQGHFPDVLFNEHQRDLSILAVTHQDSNEGRRFLIQSNWLRDPSEFLEGKFVNPEALIPLNKMLSIALEKVIPGFRNVAWHVHKAMISPPPNLEIDTETSSKTNRFNEFVSEDAEQGKISVYPVRLTLAPLIAEHVATMVQKRLGDMKLAPPQTAEIGPRHVEPVWMRIGDLPTFLPEQQDP